MSSKHWNERVGLWLSLALASLSALLFTMLFLQGSLHTKNAIFWFPLFFVLSGSAGYWLAGSFLKKSQEREEALDRLLKETIHELNIPLATIEANIELLSKNQAREEKERRRLERIKLASKQIHRQFRVVDALIRREIGKDRRERVELKSIVESAIELFLEKSGGERLRSEIPSGVWGVCDEFLFVKVIENLLANSLKYSSKGEVWVRLEEGRYLSIEDEGIGMEESQIWRVFDRYFQVDDSSEGYGVGLALVQRFAQSHGIKVRIRSQKERGTKITLDLYPLLLQNALGSPSTLPPLA
ncbi:HAMP domain-containing sensor histidine kinase [Wolinella succinogenes]|uniref:sensor histidine kinase n=1 Tax=Wolinella succinogenes TaxID=844 RepID=UPI002FC8A12B